VWFARAVSITLAALFSYPHLDFRARARQEPRLEIKEAGSLLALGPVFAALRRGRRGKTFRFRIVTGGKICLTD